ncbi:MAG TPA: 16S rRNA (cytidine(1402)-2'-O)-methyltransferase [Chloroflexota bacterium]|jgi:16S rRNA (cytidine1402-2'-O)-methyltransferase|nr:16S rRNA (cytidine(1402)-2'-O)-methyltransferase [Chloroflexota bacterium]
MSRLFVVATPIGNLGDITLRALEVLRSVPLVAAEDTRHSRKLLTHYEIKTRLVSYHAHNRRARAGELLEALAQGDVALLTDAGTPVISDPGQELVGAAAAAGHEVVAIPGPSALTAALSVSGIAAAVVHFAGFLPRRGGERRRALARWRGVRGGAEGEALVLFEAPHRLAGTLTDALAELGDGQVALCGDLTKRFEKVFRGTLSEAIDEVGRNEPRGEFTLVIALPLAGPRESGDLGQRFRELVAEFGGDRKRALGALAEESQRPRKELYGKLMVGGG